MNLKDLYSFVISMLVFCSVSQAQSTSWTGNLSTSWSSSANWTNGVPTATTDVVIGDASFTGSSQPTISSSASARSLTIGGGAKASTLTVNRNISISGDVLINSNGTVNCGAYTITLTGNWTKNGTYTGSSSSARVTFAGTTQSINVTGSAQTFRRVTVNTGSVVTTNAAVTINSLLTVNGTFDPGIFLHTIASITVANNGMLHARNATLGGNYSGATLSLSAGSIVNYSSTTTNQTVNNTFTYSTLRISGTGTKTLQGNLPTLLSSSSTQGNIYVDGGTLDLLTFTATRGTSATGGVFSVANGATLRIGGTNTFPANYATGSFSLSSTVEYYGTNQAVAAQAYGNLTLSGSSGAASVKTMPATAMTISGNLTSALGSGASVSFTAAASLKIGGSVTIGVSTTFDGASFTDSVGGSWTNNGVFTGNTGTVVLTGPGAVISGSGVHNFNNLTITSSGATATAAAMSVAGNLVTTASGSFTHTAGTLTMSGTSKTITGTGIAFDNLTVSGTVTTTSSITMTGNLVVSGSFTASTGTVTMSGTGKTISGAGTRSFSALTVTGSVTSAVNFSIGSALNVSGTFAASTPSIATFTGTATLNGTANLFDVTLTGTELKLATNAVLGIANSLTISAGSLNTTATIPNTVIFNGIGLQTVNGIAYHNLSLSGGSIKTAAAAITVNGDLTIGSTTSFAAGSFTHLIYGNWTNSGTFTAGTSTVQLRGAVNSILTGATTFNILLVNKSTSATGITLASNVSTTTLTMTTGFITTGSNTVTITGTRTGAGFIYGNIQHTHAFNSGTAYAFEGPDNTITFSAANLVTSITVSVTLGAISDFPFNGSISRVYNIAVTGSQGAATAMLRLHYEDNELNGNIEASMQLWRYNGASWVVSGKTSNNTTTNYVEQSGLASITNRWTLSDDANVAVWTGNSSTAWATPGNWSVVQGSPTLPPSAGDIVQLGTGAVTNQPSVSTAVNVKNIVFGSAAAITLTVITGGTLTTNAINGLWSASATHTINIGAQTLTVNGDVSLSDGIAGDAINLSIGTGTATITGSLTESGGANISFSGAGTMSIGGDFTYASGTFTPGTGTVVYNGTLPQSVAGVPYYNLTVNKTSGIATKNNTNAVSGSLTVSAGELDFTAATAITGDITIAGGAIINGGSVTVTAGGNWNNSGSFVAATGTVLLNGTGAQSVSATTFSNFTVNKASGTATLAGNITLTGNASVLAGTLDLLGFTAHRSLLGGVFAMSAGTSLFLSGANNFPTNYASYTLDNTSTVTYNGASAQTVAGVPYGNLVFSNGGANAKTFGASSTVNGDFTISSGATVDGSIHTITLAGNWINSGTFIPSTGTVIFAGTSKTITGNTTFNHMTITGSFSVNNNDITANGKIYITSTGSYAAGSGTHIVNADFQNSGVLTSTGIITFSGTVAQTIQLFNAVFSGVVNFNGTVPPVLNSASTPTFATLNINNTGGVTARSDWEILVAFTIGSGATFNGGSFSDTISGTFTNNGTMTSSGTILFNPSAAVTIALGSGFSGTGTIILGGSGAVTITGTPAALNNMTITNTNAAGINPPLGWTIGGSFTIKDNAIFNAAGFTYTVGGNLESNGTLNGGTSTFTMTSNSGQLFGSATTTFHHLTITGTAALVVNSDFSIDGDFTNHGSFDGTAGTLIMSGSGPSTIGGSTSPSTIAQMDIAKTNATTTLAVNVSNIAQWEVISGTLSLSTFTLTQDVGGGTLIVNDNTTLQIGGANTLPVFTTYFIDTLSTVEYNGTGSQAVNTAVNYGNLTFSGSGTKTVSGGLTVLTDFLLTGGTFTGGSFTHTIKRNWTMTAGTFTNTGTTILFNGTTNQTIKSTGAFNGMTINKTAGLIYDSTNVTVNGTLTLTLGNISTGSNSRIIGATGTVSRTSGYIIGNLQKNVALGATARTFEIGDASGYTPATISFGSVTVAGNLAATTTPGDNSNIGTSQINPAKSVNRTWTFTGPGITFNNYTITLNFLAGDVDVSATPANFYVANGSGGVWNVAIPGTRTATSTQASGLTSFGDFIIGEIFARQWDGGAGTNSWTDANNWNPDGVPAASEDAWINTAANVQVSSAVTIGGFTMNNVSATTSLQTGGSLTVNNTLTLTSGELQINGYSLILNGTIASSGTGTIKGAAGSSLTIGGTTGGNFGTIRMSAVSPNNRVQSFTLNRSGGSGAATIGTSGMEVTGTVTLTSGTLNTGGNLSLISSDLINTARIAKIETTAGISGIVSVQRFIPAGTQRRHEFWGSPIAGFTFTQLIDSIHITGPGGSANGFDDNQSGNPSAFLYDETVAGPSANGWYNPATINTSVATGTGMRIFYRGNRSQGNALLLSNPPLPQSTVLNYIGNVNTGTILLPVTCSNGCGTDDGWNLVANAYPSPIDWNAATGWTKTNISPAVYIYNPTSSVYAVWDGSVGTNGGSRYIPLGQCYYVKATGTPALSMTEDVKVATLPATQMFKTDELKYIRIGLENNNNSLDEHVIKLVQNADKGYNVQEDAAKLYNAEADLSSFSADGKLLAINAYPDFAGWDTIRLNINAAQTGTYTLTFPELHRVADLVTVYLRDVFTDTVTAIAAGTRYPFMITNDASSQGNQRFMLLLKKEVPTGVSEIRSTFVAAQRLAIYPVPAKEQIYLSGMQQQGRAELKIMNTLGQVVWSKEVYCDHTGTLAVSISELTDGIYTAELKAPGSLPFTGKFIKQ